MALPMPTSSTAPVCLVLGLRILAALGDVLEAVVGGVSEVRQQGVRRDVLELHGDVLQGA